MNYSDVFKRALGGDRTPYEYQCRLACGPDASLERTETLVSGSECESKLINIPTGLGKTAAVVLGWMWNRVRHPDEKHRQKWPRRLVYCLPMRTLVEQTAEEARRWLNGHNLLWSGHPRNRGGKVGVHLLMGGKGAGEWDLYPEENAILVGTQDMLLSRALNRGYGMSRARWPMHFGLLNNDALWVMDETQLMGAGLWTSAQLDWLRDDRFKPAKNCATWWMSATVGTAFLETKDRKDAKMRAPGKIEITDAEAAKLDILKAVRPIATWQPARAKDRKDRGALIGALVAEISAEHKKHTLSLVVCNTVATAQEVFGALAAANGTGTDLVLLTSRFRPCDREVHLAKLLAFERARKAAVKNGDLTPAHNGLICVSTQVIEAGVDISARRLWTELATWPSTLQRLGRLNRDAKLNAEAAAYVFEIPAEKAAASPYEPDDLKAAKKIIHALANKSALEPTKPIREILSELSSPSGSVHAEIAKSLQPKPAPFPRAFEVHGLFSTEPDIFGGFTDVSPWVRGGDKNADVTVFWRYWDTTKKSSPNPTKNADFTGPAFQRDEGCAVAIHRIRDFVKSSKLAFIWNDRTEQWEAIRYDDICPGMVVMLPASVGGYDAAKGWTGEKADKPLNTPPPGPFDAEAEEDDKQTVAKHHWVTLDAHLSAVALETEKLSDALALPPDQRIALIRAAALHDIGKSFSQWQEALPKARPDATTLWAKAPSLAKPGMRHEAASALAAWRRYYVDHAADFPALSIYLIAAHHGLLRTALSSRPLPARQPNVAGIPLTEPPPPLPWHERPGDNWQLDFAAASDGSNGTFSEKANGKTVFTSASPGWTALVADLLGSWEADAPQGAAEAVSANEPHSLNPFHLAFLETLLRAADCRVSGSEIGISDTEAAKQ